VCEQREKAKGYTWSK